MTYEKYWRGLCLLDPYGLDLKWEITQKAGEMKTMDLFLNFPVMAMNRGAIWQIPERVPEKEFEKMISYWGDDSWKEVVYERVPFLWGCEERKIPGNDAIVAAFQKRLKEKAHFEYVPEPIPMRNSKGAIVYYLFFASQKPVATKIIEDIFAKYRDRQG